MFRKQNLRPESNRVFDLLKCFLYPRRQTCFPKRMFVAEPNVKALASVQFCPNVFCFSQAMQESADRRMNVTVICTEFLLLGHRGSRRRQQTQESRAVSHRPYSYSQGLFDWNWLAVKHLAGDSFQMQIFVIIIYSPQP